LPQGDALPHRDTHEMQYVITVLTSVFAISSLACD